MRTIKFRAWDSSHNRMHHQVIGLCHFFSDESVVSNWGLPDPPENINLMQFTGLVDDKGREIYEGDIIEYTHKEKVHDGFYDGRGIIVMDWGDDGEYGEHYGWCIKYMKPRWGVDVTSIMRGYQEEYGGWTVVGNIYENPELL